jgi:acyl dehydratase
VSPNDPLTLPARRFRRYDLTPMSATEGHVVGEVTYDAVSVGERKLEEFPPLTRTMFVKYAGASGDFNPMHHDDTIAAQVGNPSVFGHGMLTMGLAARVVKDWFGPEAIRRFQVRFAKQVWPGDVLTCTATVTGKREEAGEQLVDLDVTVENQNGDKAVTGSATAAVSG